MEGNEETERERSFGFRVGTATTSRESGNDPRRKLLSFTGDDDDDPKTKERREQTRLRQEQTDRILLERIDAYEQQTDFRIIDLISDLGSLFTIGNLWDLSKPGGSPLQDYAAQKIEQLRDAIAEAYGVSVEILDTDQEYYATPTLERVAREGVYFLSRQNPAKTAQEAVYLIRITQIRASLGINAEQQPDVKGSYMQWLSTAHEKLHEKVMERHQTAAVKIAELSEKFRDTHEGKDPNLSQLAELLNAEKFPSPRGKSWVAQSVKRVLDRDKNVNQK